MFLSTRLVAAKAVKGQTISYGKDYYDAEETGRIQG